MARGANKAKKAARDANALRQRVALLTAEVQKESELAAAAEAAAEARDVLAQALTEATGRREERAAGYVTYLQHLQADLLAQRKEAEQALAYAQSTWDRVSQRYLRAFGGGRVGLEKLIRLTSGHNAYVLEKPDAVKDAGRAAHLTALREGRRQPLSDFSADVGAAAHQVVAEHGRPVLRAAYARAQGVQSSVCPAVADLDELDAQHLAERASNAAGVTKGTLTDDSLVWWYPTLSFVGWNAQDPYADIPDSFGAAETRTLVPAGTAFAAHQWMADRQDAEAAARDAAIARAVPRLQSVWQPLPRFARPGDAVLLRHQYALSARAAWLRNAERNVPPVIDPHRESTWSGTPDGLTETLAGTARALRNAVPFWLPPAQTSGFLESEEPDDEALAQMRLPFEAVLLAFAGPVVVDPVDPTSGAELSQSAAPLFGQHLRTAADLLLAASPKLQQDPPSIGSVLRQQGARLEGVLLLADGEGYLRDEFAWCVALPAGSADVVAGRLAIPARRSLCGPQQRALVANSAAVVCWGSWHQPDTELQLPAALDAGQLAQDRRFRELEPRGGAGGVRVLNLARTTGGRRSQRGTGRTVAPHLRRGHWRRQHHGPGSLLVKYVWVAPVLVNATRLTDAAPQVYRLRSEAPTVPPRLEYGRRPRA